MPANARDLQQGWYVPQHYYSPPRWLLAVLPDVDARPRAVYSDGLKHRHCLTRTFRRWVKNTGAQLKSRW